MNERVRARRHRSNWPSPVRLTRSTPPTVPTAGPPVLIGRGDADAQRRFSPRHAELLRETTLDPHAPWSATALWSCLDHLRVSTVTEAARVSVVDAWVDGPDAICVLYRPPFDDGRVVGLRRHRQSAVDAGVWRLGDMTTWGYEMLRDGRIDPVAFARNVADFDIGEPLGFVTTILRFDDADIGWWGDLEDELPAAPS